MSWKDCHETNNHSTYLPTDSSVHTCAGESAFTSIACARITSISGAERKRAVAPYLFSKYGLRRIPAELVVDDSRQLWGWHVGPNTDFDQSKHPFYRLFTKKDNSSLAVIDDRGGALQIVFWDKGYYHTLVSGLRSHGYQLQQVKPATNVLRFQREGSSVIADVTVWADMYVLELHN